MKKIIIPEFFDKERNLKFNKTSAFINENKCLLFEENGHIILTGIDYLEDLKNNKIPSELIRKLKSRGFIENSIKRNTIYKCNNKVKPEFIMVDLTNKCNMRCKYCLRNVNSEDKSIDDNVLTDICQFIIDYCEKEKLSHISIQPWGGEPLLKLDSILKMRQLIKCDLSKGAICLQNKGTHKIVEKNIMLAQELYENRLGSITTITKKNAPYIEEILEYYATKLNLNTIKFNFVHKSQFVECAELCLTKDEISNIEMRIFSKIIELNIKIIDGMIESVNALKIVFL